MLANDIRNYRRMDGYIAHHGILGQKWGVRRFQDKKADRIKAENNADSIKIPTDFTNKEKVLSEFNKLSPSEKEVFLDKYFDKLLDEADKGDAEIDMKASEIYSTLFNTLEHSSTVDEVYSAIWDEDYISHHGILGQKWGKKNGPPYPITPGSHSSSEKKAASAAGVKVGKSSGKGSSEGLNITQSGQKEKPGLIGSMIEGAKNAKLSKQRKQALEKAREAKAKKAEEKAAAEAHEAERQKALNSGDYNQIQKYANESSYEELQRALNKANAMQQLNQKITDSTPVEPSIMDQIDKAADMVGKATNAATKGIGAWNKFAEVYNTFVDPDSMLPEIGKNWSEEKEKRIKAKQKEVKEAEEKARKARVEEISKKLDPKLVMKNQKLFTKDELQEANNRLVTYSQLKEKADAIDKEAADAKAKKLADKQKRQAEKDEAKAKKEFEAQQAKERAKNDYLEDIENSQYNFGDDDSGFKASNPTFKKAVKEVYDYFDNDSSWGSTSISSSINSSSPKSSNTESTKKVVTDVFEYLNSNTDSRYSAPPAWQSILQSSLDEYE